MNGEMRNGHTGKYTRGRFLVGIDEAGRGPLAGPVAVAAVAFLEPLKLKKETFAGIRDSKQLSQDAREHFAGVAQSLTEAGVIAYAVSFSSSTYIDRYGIVRAVERALALSLQKLALPPRETYIKLDGLLKAPVQYRNQETIIKGDETELPITLAGIIAKVGRDREMVRVAKRYPHYGFEKHKGYGTQAHLEAIRLHGLSSVHRRSFTSI